MHMAAMGEKHRVAHCNNSNNRRQLQHSGNNSMEPALGEQSRSELVNAQSPMTDGPAELRMKIVVRPQQRAQSPRADTCICCLTDHS